MQATSASLGGLKRLGDDAKILVIRDLDGERRVKPSRREEVEPTETLEPVEVPNIQAQLQEQNIDLTAEVVNDRLDSLRPKTYNNSNGPHHVPGATFLRLMKTLDHGFTQKQLSQYSATAPPLSRRNLEENEAANSKRASNDIRSVVTRSSWQAGITSLNKRLPEVQGARSVRKGTYKQVLVNRILREIWQLVPQEEDEVSGEIEVHLKPWQLSLLEAGGSSIPVKQHIHTHMRQMKRPC